MTTPASHPRDPLHGITLETILNQLVERYGWAEMGDRIPIRCFQMNPSVKSSLTFLRKTPWARQKVEAWYVADARRARPRPSPSPSPSASLPTAPTEAQAREETGGVEGLKS
jgi:uncharacterized protein (DUF2132 family)